MTPQTHVIGRQVLDLEMEAGGDAFALQAEVGELFRTHVVPAMSDLLDRSVGPDVVLRLDRIEIDVGRLDRDQLGEMFAARVCEALESELGALLTKASHIPQEPQFGGQRWSAEEHALALWHHVLERGYLPWWATPETAVDLDIRVEHALVSLDALPPATAKMLQTNPVAMRRLALQGSDTIIKRVLKLLDRALATASLPVLDAILGLLETHLIGSLRTEVFRRNFWEAALAESLQPTAQNTDRQLVSLLRRAILTAASEASVTYGELLAHIRALAESLAASAGPPVSAAARRTLTAVLRALAESDNRSQDVLEYGKLGATQRQNKETMRESPDKQPGRKAAIGPSPQDEARKKRDLPPAQDRTTKREASAPEGEPSIEDPSSPQDQASARDEGKAEDASPAQDRSRPRDVAKTKDLPASSSPLRQDDTRSREDGTPGAPPKPLRDARDVATASRGEPLPGEAKIAPTEIDGAGPLVRGERTEPSSQIAHGLETDDQATPSIPTIREGEALYVDDAGIVLLHPFLKLHFEKLDFVRENEFVDEGSRERAVHQLRFLATGEEKPQGFLLVLAKILCGLTPDTPIARDVLIDEHAKSEADTLLKAAIGHWKALKNTSPAGLRESFLCREGRLTRKEDGWRLQVESRSYDILLDRLPWQRSVIRLPWMSELIWVDWA